MIISEVELRARLGSGGERIVYLRDGDVVTPAARDFMKAHNFRIESAFIEAPFREMSRTPIPPRGERRFVDQDGNHYAEKPEHMTHLFGNVLVSKDHPRIALRGRLDSLQAKIIEVQIVALDEGKKDVVADLSETLNFTRDILAGEVTGLPLERETLLGMREDELRSVSHDPSAHYNTGHLMPDYRMGKTAVMLNALRTMVREVELAAMAAFPVERGESARPDIIRALNRLSSAVYILICRLRGGYYGSDCDGD